MSQRVCLVAPHFPPSNLASVHRARLLANHLASEGWMPTVLTVDPVFYEERLDHDLERLVDPSVRVVRVGAIPSKWTRPFGWGDLGVRGWLPMFRALDDAARRGEIDLLHITIPSNYPALLGRCLWERWHVPYVVDYIDPWVPESDPGARFPSKAWVSFKLARLLEPVAVKRASGLAGITEGYFEGVLRRNPGLRGVPTLAFQYGASRFDHEAAIRMRVLPRRIEKKGGCIQVVYAGALLPKAVEPMRCLLRAIARVNTTNRHARPLRLVCLGTGRSPDDPGGFRVLPLARAEGAAAWVREYPERHPYLEVLATLAAADGIVVVGSTEAHYSPSKIFQAVLARRPLLALLHHASEATELLKTSGAGETIPMDSTLDEQGLTDHCARRLADWPQTEAPAVKWDIFERYDAATNARRVAHFYGEVLEYARQMKP